MAQWYVKELSRLTQVSVQTLHHYDRIKLLTPSFRLPNGYRVYTEKDLLKLQQIIALKFFGFELSQIKTILQDNRSVRTHFENQIRCLGERAQLLLDAKKMLEKILAEETDESCAFTSIIQSIEVYRMMNQFKNTWAEQSLNPHELQEYAQFSHHLQQNFTEDEKKAWESSWQQTVKEVAANLSKDPKSKIGISIGKHCMTLVNQLYGPEYAALKQTVWEKGFKRGHAATEHHMTPAMVSWLDQAIDAYYHERITRLLSELGVAPSASADWEALLIEMHGNDVTGKRKFIEAVLQEKISAQAAAWLKESLKTRK